ncbi:MAG TPA: XRE family transcriptional regulator [Sediminispirochaeta sp.]|nr:XRE family transcriptional regulator [Sediminispirochaeta sp.]
MKGENYRHIGENIKSIREKHQITPSVLAQRCGVTKEMLLEIESERVNPTIATVWKIARGLEVDIDSLLTGQEQLRRTFSLSRHEDITHLETDEEGVHIKVLSPLSMAEDLEMYILTFQAGAALHSSPHAVRTEEFLTVLKGSVKVSAGEKEVEAKTGDFIHYHADIDHRIENTDQGVSEIYMVVRFQRG